ncbi:hypothetical protein PF005_g21072 [Phytophthora fragariae]|uniref:No apical meristem-associated C-terminal domain-containing protein n=1 Tax=Phytophthora fragariae TaxID=53985 RepID=A0A6A3WJ33_9STRA|nr:hypothetical protein PF003_g19293 [Phytophthora fragariae]KAE8927816.1 hypothetical protein PF009_g22025 [Phytophthora fragariae]KAE8986857.1 hypothetical protein PF011_g19820 [Phytophthora fragariae]KAE9085707.1 hypothetical protein PF007_g21045 [Phytophthora fragariae]KAE9110001.1 hypothetical protein PF010_g11334 [Phytophthora fragariae]
MSSALLGEDHTIPPQAVREPLGAVCRTKGRNFEADEEEMLCKAYLHIGKDAGTGTGQAAAKFWSRVAEYYNEHRPDGADHRPLRSLETKWAVIQHDVSKFCGCVATVVDLNRSGTNEDDDVATAMQLYQSSHTSKGVKDNKPFKFVHCWRVLSKEPKWQAHRAPKRTATHSSSVSVSTLPARAPRPIGTKATKLASQSRAQLEHTQKRLAEATEQMAQARKKRARALEEANNYALCTIRLDELDDDAQEYFRLRRSAVLASTKSGSHENLTDNTTAGESLSPCSGASITCPPVVIANSAIAGSDNADTLLELDTA